MWLKLMRRSCFLLAGMLSLNAATAGETWRNALAPAGNAGKELVLVSEGKPLYSIVIPVQASARERTAALELRRWIVKMTGASPAIIALTKDGAAIRISADPALKEEEYRIAIEDDGDLVLSGGPGRGLMNAVFALLEEDIGCRWYARGDARLPKASSLRVSPVARTYAPPLSLRDPYYQCAFDADWSLRNRTNTPNAPVREEAGGHVDYGGYFVHTHAALLPASQYFKEHPEYFAMNAAGERYTAQLCATHPEVAKIVTTNVLAALKASPNTEIVSVSKNDNFGDQICYCETCKKLREEEGGSDMAPQLVLVNYVAEAVEKEFPQVIVDTLAYLETSGVPKTIRPRKNVGIRLCNAAVGAWSLPYSSADKCEVGKLAAAWAAVHDRMYVWDYSVNFSHYLAPMPNMDTIAANIRFWVDHKSKGVMLQAGYQGPAERDELKAWVSAKLMWNPALDKEALVRDFTLGYYGAAGPAMLEYEKLITANAKKHAADLAAGAGGIRFPPEVPYLSKEYLDSATEILARALEAAKNDDALTRKVERAELPILYCKVSRGPAFVGKDYSAILDRFERIARREGVRCLAEGPADFDAKIAAWRKATAAP